MGLRPEPLGLGSQILFRGVALYKVGCLIISQTCLAKES